MKTQDLIAALAAHATPVDAARSDRRFLARLAGGTLLALAAVLLMGARPDLADAARLPMFWIKLLVPASVAAAAVVALWRLGHPGMRLGRLPAAAALPLALLWLVAALALLAAPAGERLGLVFGRTWLECPLLITLLSVPALVLAFRAARELAPTRLPLTGAAAGLFAGAAAAAAYAIHCPESQAPFLAAWYVLGMLIPTAAGTLLGRRLLHW
ncbi:MAG: NrsF family protein [Ramlibacter sp.]